MGLRALLHKSVTSKRSLSRVVAFQRAMGVYYLTTKKKDPSTDDANKDGEKEAKRKKESGSSFDHTTGYIGIHEVFTFGAALGNEMFYILFLPFLFWNVDVRLGRGVVVMWGVLYYIGQLVKDVLKLPRPAAPPVVQLETHYAEEYGLPSTHAMSAVSLPFYMAVLCQSLFPDVPHYAGWAVAGVWCFVMVFSRLYMGVHSVEDLIAGIVLGLVILFGYLGVHDAVDAFVVGDARARWVVPAAILVLIVLYWFLAAPDKWTNAYGDTTLILGVVAGVVMASSFMADVYKQGGTIAMTAQVQAWLEPVPPDMRLFFWAVIVVARCVFGYLTLFLTRILVKSLGMTLLPLALPASDVPAKHRYAVEIPTKFLTYACVGWNAVYTVPLAIHTAEMFLFDGGGFEAYVGNPMELFRGS